jgi:hypothetical protein
MPPTDLPMPVRMARAEIQIERLVSDVESEKRTRAQVNSDIYDKLEKIQDGQDKTNRILYMMLGGLMVLQIVLQMVRGGG